MKTSITITEPCNQNWNTMTVFGNGKYCGKCKKNVIDFSGYSREEIFQKLEGRTGICGRLERSQVHGFRSTKLPTSFLSKWTVLFGLSSILGFAYPADAKSTNHTTEKKVKGEWETIMPIRLQTEFYIILGKVVDNNNQPIGGIHVILKGSKIGVQTNMDGEFTIKIPKKQFEEKTYLQFSFIGFKTQELRVYEVTKHLEIKMDEDTFVLGGMALVKDPSMLDKTKNLFNRLFSKES